MKAEKKEDLKKLEQLLMSVDLKQCKKYADNYSLETYKTILIDLPDGYLSDGVYIREDDSVSDGVLDYLYKTFKKHISKLDKKYRKEDKEDSFCEDTSDVVLKCAEKLCKKIYGEEYY
jgi:hypothetical protein